MTPIGVALAGGDSRRMGSDKMALDLGGETLPALAAGRLAAVCSEVAIADRGRRLVPGYRSLEDAAVEGPAAGILGAARAYPGSLLLVLACDLPRIPVALLAELAASSDCDWAVPRWRRGLEPLCALYGPAALDALARLAARGLPAPHRLGDAGGLAIRYLDEPELARHGALEDLFLNVNTPADLARWRRLDPADAR